MAKKAPNSSKVSDGDRRRVIPITNVQNPKVPRGATGGMTSMPGGAPPAGPTARLPKALRTKSNGKPRAGGY
jgi:hypothetical protein